MGLPKLKLPDLETLTSLEDEFEECPFNEYRYGEDWKDSGWVNTFHLDKTLSYAIQEGASDIHIEVDKYICFTILGDIEPRPQFGTLDEDTLYDLVRCMISHELMGVFVRNLECDTSYKMRFGPYKGSRFRVNIGKSFGANMLTFRVISDEIPSLNSLGIDSEFSNLFNNSTGVVLVCGATGSGKTTSLASIMRNIQLTKKKKIITVEKPVEFIYPPDGKSLIVQRNIPEDCLSFGDGLTSAMRSAPNIIMIGEVRNKEEVDELLRASETGHLSVSTIHTSNNITTLNRIRSLYEGNEQKRIMSTLGDNLRGIINQTLVKSLDGKSRFAVREILKVDFKIRKLIQEDKLSEIRKLQEETKSTMEHKLLECYEMDKCSLEEARDKSPDVSYFDYLYEHEEI